MAFSTPWAIGGGVEHTVDIARQNTYDMTGGAEGISRPGNLKVEPLQTPGTKIRVAPGGAILLNRYPGGEGQSYTVRNDSEVQVSVTATGSGGGRSDLVVARIRDTIQYEGQPPEDPNDFDYSPVEIIEDVPSDTKSFAELNENYPAIALARIDLPASTGTVEAEHITDLRQMAQPVLDTVLRTYSLSQGDESTVSNTTAYPDGGQTFPSMVSTVWDRIPIPAGASRARIMMWWTGVIFPGGNARGRVWVQVGLNSEPNRTHTKSVYYDAPGGSNASRVVLMVADDISIPSALRGESHRFYPRANVVEGVPAAERIRLNPASAMALHVEFYADPE